MLTAIVAGISGVTMVLIWVLLIILIRKPADSTEKG